MARARRLRAAVITSGGKTEERSAPVEVGVVWWPSQAGRRDVLRRAGVPRLLVIEEGPLPADLDEALEDWVRLPADEADIERRLEMLTARLPARAPSIDDYDVLYWGARWVALSEGEARIARVFVRHFGEVVPQATLLTGTSAEGDSTVEAVRVYVSRLRRRLAPLGLSITTVRSRGYSMGPKLRGSRANRTTSAPRRRR